MVSKIEIVNLCEHFLTRIPHSLIHTTLPNFKHVIMRCGWREECLKILIKVLDFNFM